MPFSERLKKACDRAGVEWSQTAIGRALGVSKQTADRWMGDGQPAADTIFSIADKLTVDARWLATGLGEMAPKTNAQPLNTAEPAAQYDDQIKRGAATSSDAEKLLVLVRTFLNTDARGRSQLMKAATAVSDAHARTTHQASRARRR